MVSYKEIEVYKPDGTKRSFEEIIKGKSIAVVGNAQSLFGREYGQEIDSHDLVIRFNKFAPLYGNIDTSSTHGNRVDIWAFWTVGGFIRTLQEAGTKRLNDAFYKENILKIQMNNVNHFEATRKHIKYTYPKLRFDILKKDVNKYSKFLKTNQRTRMDRKKHRPVIYQCSAGLMMLNWLYQCDPKLVNIYGMDFKRTATFSEQDRHNQDVTNRIDHRCKHNYELEEIYVKAVILKSNNFSIKV